MKQLTQAVFKDTPDWVQSAAVDSDGYCYLYEESSKRLRVSDNGFDVSYAGSRAAEVNGDFDTTNWQLSAIDREY